MYRPKRITDRAKPNDWFLISGNSVNDLYWIIHMLNSTLSGEDQYNIQKMIGEGILPEMQEIDFLTGFPKLSPHWKEPEEDAT